MKFTNLALTVEVLNYALALEHLEASFYKEGLKNYTQEDFIKAGMKDPFYANSKEVASDEKDHVDFLTTALRDIAYLGAAATIMSDTYLIAVGSILITEARHSAYLRAALGEVFFAQAFDNPLGFNEV
ncbi:hypothetical protein PITC_053170 [Penicillium italicum]|uniref:Ferritin-like domain-containing protein n=1 Tax=Penicillium italicum TaxID=40296 RepID=A0A0A2KJP9_PENIT|nr:hypothetical protein PITC_053170 [Penicillium italicum]